MIPEVFSLIRAMLWPLTTLLIVSMYKQEIRNILIEVPSLTRRLLSLKALGSEVILDSLSREVAKAEETSQMTTLPPGKLPERESIDASR